MQLFAGASLLRRDRLRPVLELLIFAQVVRRLEATPEQEIDLVEVEIDHRSDVQRQQLGYEKAADYRNAKRLPQFGTGAGAERDRQRAEDRREARHHDGPEPQQAGLPYRFLGGESYSTALEGEIDHHDGVFLDDADQHHDADHGDDREIHLEHDQHDQRADTRRRQAGDDGDRVDEALIEDAEHHE